MSTVALEFVPPVLEGGPEKAREEARKVRQFLSGYGMEGRVNSLLIPGMIEEEGDRPVPLKKRMDPLDTWKAIREDLPLQGMVTQVTAFHSENQLTKRFHSLRHAGIHRAVCVGVPRTMSDGEGGGVPPTEALERFKDEMPSRGVILIPTREGETGRFKFKLDKGADFALCQLLYSDHIVEFLREMREHTDRRPEILLSFGFVPKAETRVKLIRWLIKDNNPLVEKEIQFVGDLAEMEKEKKRVELLDLYKRVIDGVRDLGFPIGLHLECPYGFTDPAFETFSAMLDTWSPDDPVMDTSVESPEKHETLNNKKR
ncbi:MAG: mycobacterial-type methylenetetrahydrofolate reductase [Balneolales bacterium]